MILLRTLAFVPYWTVVFVGAMFMILLKDEDAADEMVDFAKGFWDSWR